MNVRARPYSRPLFVVAALLAFGALRAQDVAPPAPQPVQQQAAPAMLGPQFPPIAQVTQGFEPRKGFITLHVDMRNHRMLGEIPGGLLNRPFLFAVSIAGGALAGWQWDDRMVVLERLSRKLVLVEPEIRYRAQGSTLADVVRRTYRDRVITSVPILAEGPGGACLIDLNDLFVARSPLFVGSMSRGVDPSLTKIIQAKAFPRNVEIEFDLVAPGGGDGGSGTSLGARSAGAGAIAHYSLSELPQTGYQPRVADDRIGYFVTALKDFSRDPREESRFVRFVNRWNLQKADPGLELSPPKEPIIFYIEKSVPVRYRRYVEEGILEWNRAFATVGIHNAIVVRQQTDTEFADLDPEDTRYNFFRWITSEQSFAMGPSRVHPETGQILDADIIFDDAMIRDWLDIYAQLIKKGPVRDFHPALRRYLEERPDRHPLRRWGTSAPAASTAGSESPAAPDAGCPLPQDAPQQVALAGAAAEGPEAGIRENAFRHSGICDFGDGICHQVNFGLVALRALADRSGQPPVPTPPPGESKQEWPEDFIGQVVKEVVMHEVGHTLGLRHNFKASTWLSLDQINPKENPPAALTGSVMDYNPVNLAAPGKPQGYWNARTLGPYDFWAIEFGYTFKQDPREIAKICSRVAEAGLTYATDEDTSSSDPHVNTFDLGSDPLEYAKARYDIIRATLPNLVERVVKPGQGYQRARQAFDMLLYEHMRASVMSGKFVGGHFVHRDHKGDPNERPPVVPVPVEKQREALRLICDRVLGPDAFPISPDLLKYLAVGRWYHWGSNDPDEDPEYPIHDRILQVQLWALFEVLNPRTLTLVSDAEARIPAGSDALTIPEVLGVLTGSIWSELDRVEAKGYTNRQPLIGAIRRNLQQEYTAQLIDLALEGGAGPAPASASTQAWYQLTQLRDKLAKASQAPLDDYSKAHVLETGKRIDKALDASYSRTGAGGGGATIIRIGTSSR